MANIEVKDGSGVAKYVKATGVGSDVDPFIFDRTDSALSTKVGEVQASPTANTLLARLKDLLTGIILAAGTNLIGKVSIDQVTANANEVVVKSAIPAGTNNIGDVDVLSMPVTHVIVDSGVTTGLTDTQLRATAVPVSLSSVPSHAVTNAGTFAVQVTSAPTTAVTGTFWQATQPVSVASIPSHAVTNAGTFATQATLAAETTKVIGTVNISAGQSITTTPIGGITISQTPTVTAGAYSANDAVGGLLTFANAASANSGKGIINSLTLVDHAKISAPLELWLYSQSFTNTADNAVFDPSDADNLNLIGVIPISSADYFTANDNGVASIRGVGLQFQCTNSQSSIFGQLKTTAICTYVATNDVTVKLAIEYLS